MNKTQLAQLLDDKLDTMLDWLDQQPDQSFAVQKVEGKWSNGEHLEHLRKTTRAVNKGMNLPKLVLRYKFGKNNRQERSFEETTAKYKAKLKETGVKSPKEFTAAPGTITNADKGRIISWFREEKEAMKKIVAKHSEAQLSKYLLPHPLIGKLTFREFVIFTAMHTEHHFDLMKKYNG